MVKDSTPKPFKKVAANISLVLAIVSVTCLGYLQAVYVFQETLLPNVLTLVSTLSALASFGLALASLPNWKSWVALFVFAMVFCFRLYWSPWAIS